MSGVVEQIERLRDWSARDEFNSGGDQRALLGDDIRALLDAYEERGPEVERLRARIAEMEQVGPDYRTARLAVERAEDAVARLEKVVEAAQRAVDETAWEVRDAALENLRVALAAAAEPGEPNGRGEDGPVQPGDGFAARPKEHPMVRGHIEAERAIEATRRDKTSTWEQIATAPCKDAVWGGRGEWYCPKHGTADPDSGCPEEKSATQPKEENHG